MRFPRAALSILLTASALHAASWGHLPSMHDHDKAFGLTEGKQATAYKATMLRANAPGSVFFPGQKPEITFQVENLTDRPLEAAGHVEVLRYQLQGVPGDNWWPRVRILAREGRTPVKVSLPAKGWKDLTIAPPIPEIRGGYALILDLGKAGRHYVTSLIRTFEASDKRVQHPKQGLESMPPEILERLGVQVVRYGVKFLPTGSRRREETLEWLDEQFTAMHRHKVTCTAEFSSGGEGMPLGRSRPHLDANDTMLGGKTDMAWLPSLDEDFEEYVAMLVSKYGWPKGPITGVMLWNEPWESRSISGWQADIPRYRAIYRAMGRAVFRARREAGVDVLIGGCDSTDNTIDKLFGDGRETFLPMLDFCSTHYQGLSVPRLFPAWNNRRFHQGRVRVWDTESWVANTDDRFAAAVAALRAAGYDRTLASLSRIAVNTLSHHRTAYDRIQTKEGRKKVVRWVESRPLAAAYAAVQHFLGEREFDRILFEHGIPWVYVFAGTEGNADDGVVVVVGDIAGQLTKKGKKPLFDGVRCLDEVRAMQAARKRLRDLPAGQKGPRRELLAKLAERRPLTNCRMIVAADEGRYGLYDFYGNRIEAEGGKLVVPLDDRGFFLKPKASVAGSFAGLVAALRSARIEGIEPVEIVAMDMQRRVGDGPVVKLRLSNQLERGVSGKLSVRLGGLEVRAPRTVTLAPRQRRWVDVDVTGGEANPENDYLLSVTLDCGDDGLADHDELLHVNLIERRTPKIDGDLADWKGAMPQVVVTDQGDTQSFEERMWAMGTFSPGPAGGAAVAYVAHDDEFFYFAAQVADASKDPGSLRYARRDDDSFYYPDVCYGTVKARVGRGKDRKVVQKRVEYRWPEGVRHFSYRRRFDCPWTYDHDNVALAFNAVPLGMDGQQARLPGRMPRYSAYKTTDHEFVFNRVAKGHGGGYEAWRLMVPGMPRIHFFPRQPRHPLWGAVEAAKMALTYKDGFRLVEIALPWSAIPRVKLLRDTHKPVKFAFRINDNGGPTLESNLGRSICEGYSGAFHPGWRSGSPNEVEFRFER